MARGEVGVPSALLQEAAEPILARIRADAARVPPVPVGRLLCYLADHLLEDGLTIHAAKIATGVRGNRVIDLCHRQLRCAPRRYLEDRRAEVAERLRERIPKLSLERIAEAIGFNTAAALSVALERWRSRHGMPAPAAVLPAPATQPLATDRSSAEREAFAKKFARKVTLEYLVGLSGLARQPRTSFLLRGPALFRALLRVSREGCRDDRKLGVVIANEALAVLRGSCHHLSPKERAHLEIEGLVWLGHACRLAVDLQGSRTALRAARAVLEAHPDSAKHRAQILVLESALLIFERRYDEALRVVSHAIELQKEIGEPIALVRSLRDRAFVRESRGEIEHARSDLEQARGLLETIGDRYLEVAVVGGLASLELSAGDLDAAERWLALALQLARRLGNRSVWHQLWWLEGLRAQARGELRQAEERFVAARVGFCSTGDVVFAAVVALDQAVLCAETGRLAKVPALLAEVLPVAEALDLVPDQAEALRLLQTTLGADMLSLDVLKQIRDRLGPDVGAPGPFWRRRGRPLERPAPTGDVG